MQNNQGSLPLQIKSGEEEKVYTISEFVEFLNTGLRAKKSKIIGEVGEAKAGPTGHVYFTLKDDKSSACLSCIIWASKYRLFGINLEQGMKIVAYGNAEVYAPSGRLSFIADTIELNGEGDLKKQYDELKKRLEAEGVFAEENKRPVPKYSQKIGVITAKQGAVIHDFLNNVGRFGFKMQFIDSRVEGQGAVEDLLAAIKTFRKKDIDVLVIIRGGGSMESLMPFNNELLVREIAGFPVPVVVGIGHDKDVPLACLAADQSESTPTAVARALSEAWEQAILFVERLERKIFLNYGEIFEEFSRMENRFKVSVQNLSHAIQNIKNTLDSCKRSCFTGLKLLCDKTGQTLENAEKIIFLNNPERGLRLGYSLVSCKGKIVRKTSQIQAGDTLEIKVSDGTIISEAKNIKQN